MAPPANNLIMLGTLIRSFTHLEHQNPFIISWDIGRRRSVQQFRRRNGGTERRNTVDTMSVLIILLYFVSFLHYIISLSCHFIISLLIYVIMLCIDEILVYFMMYNPLTWSVHYQRI